MNRTVKNLLIFCLVLVAVIGCTALYFFAMTFGSKTPVVGYIAAESDEIYLDRQILADGLAESGVELLERKAEETNSAAVKRMTAAGAKVIIVGQNASRSGSELLFHTEDSAVTLIFVGHRPSQSALDKSDKAWYLGSVAAHGGELLGSRMAEDFKSGLIPDLNGDALLQVLVLGDGPITDYALEQCEHLGIYTQVLPNTDENGEPLPLTAEVYASLEKPEFILCQSGIEARQAHDLAAQLGWLDSEMPVRIGCTAANADNARALLTDGIVSMPVPYYDLEGVTRTATRFALNALDSQFVAQGTDLVPNSEDQFIIPYQLME